MLEPSTIAAIRYGFGFHPAETPPTSAETLLARLSAHVPQPRISYSDRADILQRYREANQADDEAGKRAARRNLRSVAEADLKEVLVQAVTRPGFPERLTHFWVDHFTVAANNRILRLAVPDFVATAIRPHVAGRFADMLRAATLHPAMLIYLDQASSIGPNSIVGKRRERGLNENLAREVLELHSLGVNGPYDQTDVRELARLMTGLSVDQNGFRFRNRISEPGQMSILGNKYGRRRPGLDQVEMALDDIAMHPATARHIASKLIVHFIGGEPDPAWIEEISKVYLASDSDLASVYAALLADERAWATPFLKAKTPFEFIVSAFRAGGARRQDIDAISGSDLRQGVAGAMGLMGQTLFMPPGPNGWPEDPEAWITPPSLAARIRWATAFAERALNGRDPRAFLETTLHDAASELLRIAVAGSESHIEGLALTLASPEFNRR